MKKVEELRQFITSVVSSKDVRSRVIFTLLVLLLYRLGSHVRVPGIDQDKLKVNMGNSPGLSGWRSRLIFWR